jgi:hypothetical protein
MGDFATLCLNIARRPDHRIAYPAPNRRFTDLLPDYCPAIIAVVLRFDDKGKRNTNQPRRIWVRQTGA